MKLCNFSNTKYHLNWYKKGWLGLNRFLETNGLDGIELLLHGNYNIESIPKEMIKGLHLSYFPTWLDFYLGDHDYKEDFPTEEDVIKTFGANDPVAITEKYHKEFNIAEILNVDYMVFHVSHVSIKEAFTFDFKYSDRQVLEATAEIVNQAFDQDSDIDLLFENLWWPGLNLSSRDDIEYFMSLIDYKNKGIMLDLSHLMITKPGLKSASDSIDFIIKHLKGLGESIKWIKGIHINGTKFSGHDFDAYQSNYDSYKKDADFMTIYKHISSMDQHIPLEDQALSKVIELIKPKYQMIEVIGKNKEDWEMKVKTQLEYI